jgi:DNA-binding CsgD family transcriptional regulator
VLHNGLGHHDAALEAARRACEHVDLGFYGWCLAELVEAAARTGDRAAGEDALAKLAERTEAAGTDWALGQLARSRALLDETGAEDHYLEAIERLGRTRMAVHHARAHLVYGEWLRRRERPREARRHLRTAHEMFVRMDARAFADRAGRELRDVGDSADRRAAHTGQELTAQESQIARLAGDGLTNPEIGAQLFISPHTVDWHLRKVYAKLGITSRRQLRA